MISPATVAEILNGSSEMAHGGFFDLKFGLPGEWRSMRRAHRVRSALDATYAMNGENRLLVADERVEFGK
jgi:hypothetical protein